MGRAAENKLDKLERILGAGRELLARRGFAGMTMDELAAVAGVSKGAVYFHVGSKVGLVNRLFEEDFRRWIAEAFEPRDDGPLLDQLVVAFARLMTAMCGQPDLTRVYMSTAGGSDQWDRASGAMHDLLGRTAALLDEAKATGELTPDVRSDQLAYNLWALYFVEQHRWLLDQPGRPNDNTIPLRRTFSVQLAGYVQSVRQR